MRIRPDLDPNHWLNSCISVLQIFTYKAKKEKIRSEFIHRILNWYCSSFLIIFLTLCTKHHFRRKKIQGLIISCSASFTIAGLGSDQFLLYGSGSESPNIRIWLDSDPKRLYSFLHVFVKFILTTFVCLCREVSELLQLILITLHVKERVADFFYIFSDI